MTQALDNIKQLRAHLAKQIETIEKRLNFSHSKPLEDHLNDLLRKDMQLACQETDLLVSKR